MSFVILLSLLKSVISQGCGNDVVVDDFSTVQHKFFDGANRVINKIGGDYGTDGRTTFTIDTAARTLTVVPRQNENVNDTKCEDERACFDLTKYYAFQFDLEAPLNATGTFTLTQMKADCSGRVDDGDSIYQPLSKYYTTPGQKQTIVMPFADFTQLAQKAGSFDFVHLKDWTFVDMKPLNQPFVLSNLKLIGGAPGCSTTVAPRPTSIVGPETTFTTQDPVAPTQYSLSGAARISTWHFNSWLMILWLLI